jgi:hypothetical protein
MALFIIPRLVIQVDGYVSVGAFEKDVLASVNLLSYFTGMHLNIYVQRYNN